MRVALMLIALGACSYPEKELTDGAGTPFGCLNAPAPTRADNPSAMSGKVVDATRGTPLNNAAVSGQLVGNPASIFVAHTDASGNFRQSQNTGNMPLDIYLTLSANGYLKTFWYPAYPLTHDIFYPSSPGDMAAIQLFSETEGVAAVSGSTGVTFDATKGWLLLTVDDCNGTPLAGATITTTPAGTIRYFAGVTPSMTATATDQGGIAMVANLPPGNVALSATVNGMTLKTHNMQVVANAFIQTQIQP